jgi:hypothetical protein
LAVHRVRSGLQWQSCVQHAHSANKTAFRDLADVSNNDFIYQLAFYASASHGFLNHKSAKIVLVHILQTAAHGANCSSHPAYDNCLSGNHDRRMPLAAL